MKGDELMTRAHATCVLLQECSAALQHLRNSREALVLALRCS